MGDATRNRSDRVHSSRVPEFGLQLRLVSDVTSRAHYARHARAIVTYQRHCQIELDSAAIFANGTYRPTIDALFSDFFQEGLARIREGMTFIILVRIAVYDDGQAAILRLLRRVSGQDFERGIDELNLSRGIGNKDRVMTMVHRASQVKQCLRRPVRRKILTAFEFLGLSRHIRVPTVTSDVAPSGFRRSVRLVPLVTIAVAQYGNVLFSVTSRAHFGMLLHARPLVTAGRATPCSCLTLGRPRRETSPSSYGFAYPAHNG